MSLQHRGTSSSSFKTGERCVLSVSSGYTNNYLGMRTTEQKREWTYAKKWGAY